MVVAVEGAGKGGAVPRINTIGRFRYVRVEVEGPVGSARFEDRHDLIL